MGLCFWRPQKGSGVTQEGGTGCPGLIPALPLRGFGELFNLPKPQIPQHPVGAA